MLKAECITAVCDTREKAAYDLAPLQVVEDTLQTGDITVRGLESEIAVERKSLGDFISCCTFNRERWERELHRLMAYRHALIVIEAPWADITTHKYRSKATPASIVGSVMGWISRFQVPILFFGSRAEAEDATRRFLFITAKRIFERTQSFRKEVVS